MSSYRLGEKAKNGTPQSSQSIAAISCELCVLCGEIYPSRSVGINGNSISFSYRGKGLTNQIETIRTKT